MRDHYKKYLTFFSIIFIFAMTLSTFNFSFSNSYALANKNVLKNEASDDGASNSQVMKVSTEDQDFIALNENLSKNITNEEYSRLQDMDEVLENQHLKLYIDNQNAGIAILDKTSGKIWFSNPSEYEDTSLPPQVKGKLLSQISFVYLTKNGQTKEYNSYDDSVRKKQFEIKKLDSNSISVVYQFGSQERGIEVLPQKISKERFESILLDRLKDEEDKKQLKSRYRYEEEQGIYTRRPIPQSAIKTIIEIFDKAGYTDEDLELDNKENNIKDTDEILNARFVIELVYALDGENFVATLNTRNIDDNKAFRIHTIKILENFGAAGVNDKGYSFIPDGSGALVYHNNGKTFTQSIIVPMYGEDKAIFQEEKIGNREISRMPVFGLKKNDSALFAIIEEGDAIAAIHSEVSGKLHKYNTVCSQFEVLPKDIVKLGTREFFIKMPRKMYEGDLKIRYSFLSGKDANYSGMANYYREYLVNKYKLEKVNLSNEDIPFYLELTGVVSKPNSLFGITYEKMIPLTNINQASQIINKLQDNGISNINVNYKGWFNGGLMHSLPTKIKVEGSLGGKKALTDFVHDMSDKGVYVYPNVSFLRVYKKTSEFKPSKHASLQLSRKITKVYDFNLATYRKDYQQFSHFVVSPNSIDMIVNKFLNKYKKFDFDLISLHDFAEDLNSDFRDKNPVNRQYAANEVVDKGRLLYQQIPNIMLSGGNIYMVPYANHILNVPQESNYYITADESIPFYEMVLHGYVEYAGKPFNVSLDQDMQIKVLKSLETGSNVYYSWIGSESDALEDTGHNELYAHYYMNWLNEAVKAYNEVNSILKQVRGEHIISHEKLADNIFKTVYSNGKKIIVNYKNEKVVIEGKEIGPKAYIFE